MARPNPSGLQYVGLSTGLADRKPPRLLLSAPSGVIREVTMTRHQLEHIIQQAASALAVLDKAGA